MQSQVVEIMRVAGAKYVNRRWEVSCDPEMLDALPVLELFAESETYASFLLRPEDYVYIAEGITGRNGRVCFMGIMATRRASHLPIWYLGKPFMRRFYTSYNLRDATIGVGLSTYKGSWQKLYLGGKETSNGHPTHIVMVGE